LTAVIVRQTSTHTQCSQLCVGDGIVAMGLGGRASEFVYIVQVICLANESLFFKCLLLSS